MRLVIVKINQRNRALKLLVYCSLFLTAFLISSCKKFVEVQVPKTLLYSSNTFNSNGTATAALTAIYSQMGNDLIPFTVAQYTGMSGDELITNSTLPEFVQIYKNNIQPLNSYNKNLWSLFYKYIYQANSIIEGLNTSTGLSIRTKNQLTGEAKFIRAYCLFDLTNLYGDIPIITSTDYRANNSSFRSAQKDVYAQIVKDLKDAQSLLNTDYVSVNDSTSTTERIRPNSFAASALLARVYLYEGDWNNADLQATSVINSPLYDTVSLDQVFLKNEKEAIWQIQPDAAATGFNTSEGKYFILTGPLDQSSTLQNSVALSSELLNSFESGDLRRSAWIKDTVFGSTNYSFPYKYKVNSSSDLLEYSTVLRLGEVYLLRAEARAQLGAANAVADLNVIRKRAGLANYSGATDKTSLLAAILHERQVEFFTEQGHRWFDLKRTGKIDAVMTAYAPTKGATWNSPKQLFPIPQNERNNDPNLTQNSGY